MTKPVNRPYKKRGVAAGKYIGENNPSWKGGKAVCMDCGKLTAWYTAKRCRACSDLHRRGPNHHNWKGGISENVHSPSEPRYKKWRMAVFTRDGFQCKCCGAKGYLEAHHIKSWSKHPELRYEIDNGESLCKKCHSKTPNYKGKKQNE